MAGITIHPTQEIEGTEEDIMLVGHMPFMNKLASRLLSGNPEADCVQFQQGGVLMLERSEGQWRVGWMVIPAIL